MEEHSLRRASITNNMHEQKRKEKGGVIGAFLSKIVNCVVLEGNVIANQSHAPHDPPPKEGVGALYICQITAFPQYSHSRIIIKIPMPTT
jgi:hypothetical protein